MGVSDADRILGRLLVEQGLVTQERISECLDEIQRLSDQGTPARLGEVLQRKGFLSPAHFEATVRASVVYRVRKKLAKRKALTAATVAGIALAAGLWLYFSPRLDRSERFRRALDRVNVFTTTLTEQPERRAQAGAEAVRALEAALAVDPLQTSAWVWLGRCRRALGQDPSDCWERALAIHPDLAEALLERGRQKLERYRNLRGEPEAGHTAYREHVFYRPVRPERPEEILLRESGEKDLSEALKVGISGHLGAQLDALAAFGRGDYARAESAAGSYLARAPWDAETFLLRARARRFLRKYKPAEEDCRRALDLEPENAVIFLILFAVLRDDHRPGDAEQASSEAARRSPRNAMAFYAWGQALTDLNQWRRAETAFDEAIKIDPGFAWAWSGRGWARHSMGQLDRAEQDYTLALELDAGDGFTWNRRAFLRQGQDRLEEAFADYTKGIERDPVDPTAPGNRANIHVHRGRLKEADADYAEAIRRDPLFADAWASRGKVRGMMGRAEESEADFAKALKLEPKGARIFALRGSARSIRGDFVGALADAQEAEKLAGAAELGVPIAYALAHAGRFGEGLARFRKIAEAGAYEYAHLWVWLLRARLGEQGAAADLRAYRRKRAKEDWFARVADLLAGDASEADVLKAAESPDARTDREQKCEGFYYAGMKRLLAGDRDGARALFEKSIATGVTEFVEYAGSRAELQRLK